VNHELGVIGAAAAARAADRGEEEAPAKQQTDTLIRYSQGTLRLDLSM
jgi:hypothetical protein